MDVKAGSTDVTTYFALRLTADGSPATGLTITDLDLQYTRSGATPAAKVDATALGAANSAHGDNQAFEIDGTDQPGVYRVDWPDAAFASGVREVILTVKHTTAVEHLRVNLTPVPSDIVQFNGVNAQNEDFTVASATSTTVVLPSTDSAGNSIPDNDQYTDCDIQVVAGTGIGQIVSFTTNTANAREYNVLAGTMPVQLDNTSKCIFLGSNRSTVRRWLNGAPNALDGGRLDSSVGSYQSGKTPLQPTVDSRTLAVETTGEVGRPAFLKAQRCMVLGTVTTGASTTVIPTSSLSPAAVDTNQFSGRVLIFSDDTTTTGLRGQGGRSLSSTSGGQITLETADALSQAPASGDTFVIT